MNLTNFKNLGLSAYEYFWAELGKKYSNVVSERDFLKGSIWVPKSISDPYSFDKEKDFKQNLSDYTVSEEGNQTEGINILRLPCSRGSGYLLWLRSVPPFKTFDNLVPIESFEGLAVLRSGVQKIGMYSSNEDVSSYVVEDDFSPKLCKEIISRINLLEKNLYLIIDDFFYSYMIKNPTEELFMKIDKSFSHFDYSIFSDKECLLTVKDGSYKVILKRETEAN
jgi:hypothetical protein